MASLNKNSLVVPDFITTVQELQAVVSGVHPEARQDEAQKAIAVIGKKQEYAGSGTVLVHALSAYIVLECMDRVEVDTIYQDEMIVSGALRGVSYLEDGPALSTLCIALRASTVKWRPENKFSTHKRIDDLLFIPAFSVESIWPAA